MILFFRGEHGFYIFRHVLTSQITFLKGKFLFIRKFIPQKFLRDYKWPTITYIRKMVL